MCTVSYLATEKGFVLTSSRDEKVARKTIAPQYYMHGKQQLIYPKDSVAGGTWIATDGKSRLACLLNGAFDKHERKESYVKSRGKVVLEAFTVNTHEDFEEFIRLHGVEPFTLILLDFGQERRLTEFRWDETTLHKTPKDLNGFYIWSSSTLYDAETRKTRELWFRDWVTKFREEDDYNILNFHLNRHSEREDQDILMDRHNGMQTVSVTQFLLHKGERTFHHLDLLENTTSQFHLND